MNTINFGVLKGKSENSFKISSGQSNNNLTKAMTISDGFISNNIIAPPIMNRAIQNVFALKTRGCKDEPESHIIVRRKPISSTMGLYPQTGIFRHSPKGLATQPSKPNNLPIMPLADFFFAGMDNRIPIPS